jgi:hypothetical protein
MFRFGTEAGGINWFEVLNAMRANAGSGVFSTMFEMDEKQILVYIQLYIQPAKEIIRCSERDYRQSFPR